MMAFPSYVIANGMTDSRAARWGIGALLLTTWDLTLDPAMSSLTRYWVWETPGPYYGMPLVNLAGWFATGVAIMAGFDLVRADEAARRIPVPLMETYYATVLALSLAMTLVGGILGSGDGDRGRAGAGEGGAAVGGARGTLATGSLVEAGLARAGRAASEQGSCGAVPARQAAAPADRGGLRATGAARPSHRPLLARLPGRADGARGLAPPRRRPRRRNEAPQLLFPAGCEGLGAPPSSRGTSA